MTYWIRTAQPYKAQFTHPSVNPKTQFEHLVYDIGDFL